MTQNPHPSVLEIPQESAPEESTVLEVEEQPSPLTEFEVEADSLFFSAATGRSIEETRFLVEQGRSLALGREADSITSGENRIQVEQALDADPEFSNDIVAGLVDQMRGQSEFSRFLAPSLAAAVRQNVPGAREVALDRVARVIYMGDSFRERIGEMQGVGETIVDFAEVLLSPFEIFSQRTYRDLTRRVEALLVQDLSAEEFEEALDGILDEAEDAGLFSDQNRFMLEGFMGTLGSGLYSDEQEANEALGWLDLALTGGLEVFPGALRAIPTGAAVAAGAGIAAGAVVRGAAGRARDAARDALTALSLLPPSERNLAAIREGLNRALLSDPGDTPIDAAMHTHLSMATPTITRGGFLSAPTHETIRMYELSQGTFLERVRDLSRESGEILDVELIRPILDQVTAQRRTFLQQRGDLSVIDVDFEIGDMHELYVVDIIGREDGSTFRSFEDAYAFARREFGEEPTMLGDQQWAILRRENISPDNLKAVEELGFEGTLEEMALYRATDPELLGDGFWARVGSVGAQADPAMAWNLFRGESVYNRVIDELEVELRGVTATLSRREIAATEAVFPHMAGLDRTIPFNNTEFRSWYFSTYHTEASDAQLAYYRTRQDILDGEAFIYADGLYRDGVTRNLRVLSFDGDEYVVERVNLNAIPTEDQAGLVYTGGVQPRAISEFGEGDVVYRVVGTNRDLPGNLQFFSSPEAATRSVRHSDFLQLNAGGHRGYSLNEMQFVAKQPNIHTFADGTVRESSPRTLGAYRTRAELDMAIEDINTIIEDITARVRPSRIQTADEYIEALRPFRNNADIRNVVRANNGFNTQITDLDSLLNFVRDRGLDLRRPFRGVAEGDMLDDMTKLGDTSAPRGITQGQAVYAAMRRGGRGAMPLIGYGGRQIQQRPIREVLHGATTSALNMQAELPYRIRAAQGTIKAAIDTGVMRSKYRSEGIDRLPLRTQVERILKDDLIDVSGASGAKENLGRRFRLDLQRIQFRMQSSNLTQRVWEKGVRHVANFLYGKDWVWAAHRVDRFSTNPVDALRGLAFDLKLGMFNPVQYIMQGMQVVNVVGVAGLDGIRGAALYGPIRLALNNGNPEVVRRLGRLIGPVVDLSEDEFVNMIEMLRRSGRAHIENNVAELSAGEDAASRFGVGRVGDAIQEARTTGRVFFREGDLMARITAFASSYLKYRNTGRTISGPSDRRAVEWITNEEQRLTQYMTTASRQAYEKLPFMQFMTYQLRITEAIFAGTFNNTKRVLTKGERNRLAVAHFTMFGAMATGPTQFLMDYISSNSNVDMDSGTMQLVQGGILEVLTDNLLGADTAVSRRFSSSGMIYQLMRQMAEDNVLEIFGGPSAEVGMDFYGSGLSVIYNGLRAVASGDFQATQDDILSFVRVFSSGNSTHNAIYAYQTGRFLNRQGGAVVDDLTTNDAIALAFGIPLQEVDEVYTYLAQRRHRNSFLERTARGINELHGRITEATLRQDWEAVASYYRQIGIALGGLSLSDRERVENRVFSRPTNTIADSLMLEQATRSATRFLEGERD